MYAVMGDGIGTTPRSDMTSARAWNAGQTVQQHYDWATANAGN
jgi:hypothetical protein